MSTFTGLPGEPKTELPWWAVDNPALADDPYHQGYFARFDGQPRESSEFREWREGWDDCDAEIAEGLHPGAKSK